MYRKELSPTGVLNSAGEILRRKEHPMLDVIMLAIALGFFALSIGYTIACDRL